MPRRRPDGVAVEGLNPLRRFMPFVVRRRNEALVWFEHDIEVDRALGFAERFGQEKGIRVTFFHLVLRALARTLHEFPRLNRYVVGRRLYQRTDIALSFSGKEALDENAPLYVRKVVLDPLEPLEATIARIEERIAAGRAGTPTASDREIALLLRLPWPVVDLAVWSWRLLDHFGLLPARMIEDDPLYASAFVANLGSVGIPGAYHHLYEHGTIPIFVAVGSYRYAPVALPDGRVESRRVATLKYTYDERIEDGFTCARALARLEKLLEEPEQLR
jgi:hypothetical protein